MSNYYPRPTESSASASKAEMLKRKPQRISITISQSLLEALEARALREGRSLSNLAAFLLEAELPN